MALTFFAVSVSAGDGGPLAGEDENLPWFGRYYGNAMCGPHAGVGNTTFNRRYASFFFWADRTAVIAGFQWHIRYDASGYSGGDGGTYTVRIVEADPATKLPKFPLVTICSLSGYKPAQEHGFNATSGAGWTYGEKTFTQQGQVIAKQPYCLLFENTGGFSSNYVATNIDRPVSYFNNPGPVPYAKPEEFWNPTRIHLPGGQVRAFSPWTVVGRGTDPIEQQWRRFGPPIMTIRYADGIHSGWGIVLSGSTDLYTEVISGNNQIRDRVRVTRAARVIDEIYLWPFLERGQSKTGNLVVTLEQGPSSDTSGNGTVIEELTYPVSQIYELVEAGRLRPVANETSDGADDHDKIPYITLPCSQPRTLQLGQLYNIRLRSTGSPVLIRVRNCAEAEGLSPDASSWEEHEQIRKLSWLAGEDSRGSWLTSNGGSSWSKQASARRFGWVARCVVG